MGSLRNPIGPLPSSIYWRRRAVALAILALLVLLVVWAVNLGGGDGKNTNDAKGPDGQGPATSITPGPNATDSGISQKPGGRDESSGGSGSGTGPGGGSGGSGGAGSGGAGSGGSGGGTGAGAGSGAGVPIGEGPGGNALPAGSPLPNCAAGTTELKLRSVKNSYGPDEKPKFELVLDNTSGSACKVDLGRTAAVLTVTAEGGDRVWSSGDCPSRPGAALVQIPGKQSTKRTVEWDRVPSAPQCATPDTGSVQPGTYLLEAKVPGLTTARVSFVLAKD